MGTNDNEEVFITKTGRRMSAGELDELAAEYAPGGPRRAEVDQAIEEWTVEIVGKLDSDDPEIRHRAEDTVESLRRYHGQ